VKGFTGKDKSFDIDLHNPSGLQVTGVTANGANRNANQNSNPTKVYFNLPLGTNVG